MAPPGLGTNYYPDSIYANILIGPMARHNLNHTRKEADKAAHIDFDFILYHPVCNVILYVTDPSRDVLKKIIADAIDKSKASWTFSL